VGSFQVITHSSAQDFHGWSSRTRLMPKIEFRDHHHMAKNHLVVRAIDIFIQGALERLSETCLRRCLEFCQAITGETSQLWDNCTPLSLNRLVDQSSQPLEWFAQLNFEGLVFCAVHRPQTNLPQCAVPRFFT
jgi:hypothetical protein